MYPHWLDASIPFYILEVDMSNHRGYIQAVYPKLLGVSSLYGCIHARSFIPPWICLLTPFLVFEVANTSLSMYHKHRVEIYAPCSHIAQVAVNPIDREGSLK